MQSSPTTDAQQTRRIWTDENWQRPLEGQTQSRREARETYRLASGASFRLILGWGKRQPRQKGSNEEIESRKYSTELEPKKRQEGRESEEGRGRARGKFSVADEQRGSGTGVAFLIEFSAYPGASPVFLMIDGQLVRVVGMEFMG